MGKIDKSEINSLNSFYERTRTLFFKQKYIGKLKRGYFIKFGIILYRKKGVGAKTVVFTLSSKKSNRKCIYFVLKKKNVIQNKIRLLNLLSRYRKLHFKFKNFSDYNINHLNLLQSYFDQLHPEAVLLTTICNGKGIDVGCGYRKTHPTCIGVDWVAKGSKGKYGNVLDKLSEADVVAKGDNLKMFADNSLDYLVSRHNLEHYKNPKKTLMEWVRIIKPGGFIGIIVPNGENPHTDEETHYSYFNKESLRELVKNENNLKIVEIGECIKNWSFYCFAKKVN